MVFSYNILMITRKDFEIPVICFFVHPADVVTRLLLEKTL